MDTPIKVEDVTCSCCGRNTNIRKDYDYPETILCCDDCGADFNTDLTIILEPRNL